MNGSGKVMEKNYNLKKDSNAASANFEKKSIAAKMVNIEFLKVRKGNTELAKIANGTDDYEILKNSFNRESGESQIGIAMPIKIKVQTEGKFMSFIIKLKLFFSAGKSVTAENISFARISEKIEMNFKKIGEMLLNLLKPAESKFYRIDYKNNEKFFNLLKSGQMQAARLDYGDFKL